MDLENLDGFYLFFMGWAQVLQRFSTNEMGQRTFRRVARKARARKEEQKERPLPKGNASTSFAYCLGPCIAFRCLQFVVFLKGETDRQIQQNETVCLASLRVNRRQPFGSSTVLFATTLGENDAPRFVAHERQRQTRDTSLVCAPKRWAPLQNGIVRNCLCISALDIVVTLLLSENERAKPCELGPPPGASSSLARMIN